MSSPIARPILLLSGLAVLSGCAAGGEFPSLAPRAIELDDAAAATPEFPAGTAAVDPQLASRLAALLADARRGQDAFATLLPTATDAVAAAGDAGSEMWIAAQLAISRLEAQRAPTVVALAELDQLAIDKAGTPQLSAVMMAVGEVRALAEGQEQRIGALRERLSPL